METSVINNLITPNEKDIKAIKSKNKCDKYDYLTAAACGAVGGVIDIFLVGAPNDSVLLNWTDKQADKAVMSFAKIMGWKPRAENSGNVASAIGFLEKKFVVNYDQKNTSDVTGKLQMGTKNHHMKSLAHSPDIIGLFFSLLNQFTSTSTFLSNGQLITISTETYELVGGNFVSKLFCGFVNWLGHIMSDVAGSSGARGNGGRGSGVVMPFFELFSLCDFGKFSVGKDKQTLAEIATRAFQSEYDLRFGAAMSIPVFITEMAIRLIWILRQHFQFGKSLKECIFPEDKTEVRVMLLIGNATLCLIDGVDAAVRSDGNALMLFLRLNLSGWYRLIMLCIKEIFIRLKISADFDEYIESYQAVNLALQEYLAQLEAFDLELYIKETHKYDKFILSLSKTTNDSELNVLLISTIEELNIDKPWEGEFDDFMSNQNNKLVFK